METGAETIARLRDELAPFAARLIAVSKTKPAEKILEVYRTGQRDFGENYVQELTEKQPSLPQDIRWHFIGHLQTNKVKYIAGFVHCIHGVDSLRLLKEIEKQAARHDKVIDCLLQLHIAREETKFGLSYEEAEEILEQADKEALPHVRIAGFMGMASNTEDSAAVRAEFNGLRLFFDRMQKRYPDLKELSMGMSADYRLALEEGSTMVRIGSSIFGVRPNHSAS
jgi:pyridoxal phosphate enzyme (YggS family)